MMLSTTSRETKSAFCVYGLTGGIASGKSTAARYFEQAGLPVIDADRISRELSQTNGAAYPAILKRFGTADRARLREIVFSDPKSRKDLEAILHPLIQAESLKQMRAIAAKQGASTPILYEATLLVETGRYKDFQGLIVVEAPAEKRIERLILRDGATEEMARNILSAQLSDEKRREAATHVIQNAGDLRKLKTKVEELAQQLKQECAKRF